MWASPRPTRVCAREGGSGGLCPSAVSTPAGSELTGSPIPVLLHPLPAPCRSDTGFSNVGEGLEEVGWKGVELPW